MVFRQRYSVYDEQAIREYKAKSKGCCPECIKMKQFVKVRAAKLNEDSWHLVIHVCPKCGYVIEQWMQPEHQRKEFLERCEIIKKERGWM
jgi:hypothetical protein